MEESHNTSLDLWALKGFQKIMSNEEMDIYKTTIKSDGCLKISIFASLHHSTEYWR